jgi:hypothetical protein
MFQPLSYHGRARRRWIGAHATCPVGVSKANQFLNEVVEAYLLKRKRSIDWTRSRAYKKNDQARVEQKNFTHVRQLLGYGRFGHLDLKKRVDDLYEEAWLPLRNYFTPVMKWVEKQRIGSKVQKKYDKPLSPCDRLLACEKVSEETKSELRKKRREEMERAGENKEEEHGKESRTASVGMALSK